MLSAQIGSVHMLDGFLNVGILTATSKENFLGSVLVVTDALSDIVENCDKSAKNFVFEIYNQQNVVFEQGIADELCKNAKENGVSISVISRSANTLSGFQKRLINNTKGIEHTKSLDFVKEVYEHVYKEKYIPKEVMPVILSTGFRYVVLDSKLYPNGRNPYGKDSDTDNDGVTDWDEVRNDLLKYDNEGNYALPTIGDCINSLDDVPFYVENVFKAEGDFEDKAKLLIFSRLWDCEILPIKSDPTNVDGDEDGLDDVEENKLGSSPLSYDTDGDGLDDGTEYYIGTNLLECDTDGDGLSDYEEVELWYDPLDANPDGDKFNDYEEYKNHTNPFVYDYTKAEQYREFLIGAALGDWDTADNIPQLLGQISSSFVPFVADARDYFANVFKNHDKYAALIDLSGFLLDLGTHGTDVATDAAKAASKLGKFISKNADDVPKVVEAIKQTSKQLSKGDDALHAVVNSLDSKALDKISDSLQSTKNITKADYKKSLDILEAAGRSTNEIIQSGIASIVKKYENLQCTQCADEIVSYLKSNNLQGFRYEIDVTPLTRGRDFIYSDTFGDNIATNGHHIGVMFDDLIFDNHHPNGISFEEWLSDLFCPYGNGMSLYDLYKSGELKIPPKPI